MKQDPMTTQSQLRGALRKELDKLDRHLAYHKEVLERFQRSPAWRWTAPARWVANLFRNLGSHSRQSNASDPDPVQSAATVRVPNYFTGLCRVSFENFSTSGAALERPGSEGPETLAILQELAAKEKEIEQQKWVFARFLESPAWRWTAPIRVASEFLGLGNGYHLPPPPVQEGQASEANSEIKKDFSELCRFSLENFLNSAALLELPRSENPTVSIIVVLFNRAELTFACLRSIVAHCEVDCELVIVDNDSKDETSRLLERLRGAHIIRNSTNRHFLAAVNQAARECHGEYLLLLNNDAQLLPGAVQSALETLRSSPDIGAVGGRIILLDGTLQEAGSIVWKDGSCAGYGRGDEPFAPMYSFRRDVDYCSGAFLLTAREVWNDLGGFDHAFEPAYYEETDYCMRLWERGMRVVYEPTATILHYEFGSSQSALAAISLQARNQKRFAERHRRALERHEDSRTGQILRARSAHTERRILLIDDRVPHVWLGSGFPRANAMHWALRRMGYFVTLYPLDVIAEPWDQVYSDFPSEVEVLLGSGRELLETFLGSRRGYYSGIIISRPHNMRLLAAIRKAHPDWFEGTDVIYDAEALFVEREIGIRQLAGRPMSEQELSTAVAEEIQLAAAADRVITVSGSDRQAFLSHGIRCVDVLGHSIEPVVAEVPFASREGLLFVGAVHDELSPNADALIWFLREIFPRIQKKLGDLPLTIAGVNRSKRIRDMALPPVCITGHLPSLAQLYLKSRVFVAPTRFAAGIPHKVHEAAAHGVPVVTTPLLARQLGWSERELGIAEDSESFAERCIQIYTDESRWSSLREAALERVRSECSPEVFDRTVARIFSRQES
jgi:GT2 family glycosyltransferase